MEPVFPALTIRSGAEHVSFEFVGYARDDVPIGWAQTFLSARVSVRAEPFYGAFDATIGLDELANLRVGLQKLWDAFGKGEQQETFNFLEVPIRFEFNISERGYLVVQIECAERYYTDIMLKMVIRAEYMLINAMIEQIEEVMRAYSV